MKKDFKGVEIEVAQGDIVNQPKYEAVVNAANAQLTPGGGVAGAIHEAAVSQLYLECKKLAPINPGEAVLTSAYKLPNKYIIHCLGPRYKIDEPADKLLANCYIKAVELAEKHKISSVAFPAIATGIFGYPPKEAVKIVFSTISKVLGKTQSL